MNSSNFNNHIRKIGKLRYTTLYDIIILRNIFGLIEKQFFYQKMNNY